MKTKLVVPVFLASLLLLGCSDNNDDIVQGLEPPVSEILTVSEISGIAETSSMSKGSIGPAYSKSQEQVLATFGAIAQSIIDGAGEGYDSPYMNQLISFHAYGPKFTEFNDGYAYDSAGNEHNERTLFGETIDEVVQFAAIEGTLKVAVYYGNVANLTFISDFTLIIDEVEYDIHNLITLLFVRTNEGWKMVHEHHSPFKGVHEHP